MFCSHPLREWERKVCHSTRAVYYVNTLTGQKQYAAPYVAVEYPQLVPAHLVQFPGETDEEADKKKYEEERRRESDFCAEWQARDECTDRRSAEFQRHAVVYEPNFVINPHDREPQYDPWADGVFVPGEIRLADDRIADPPRVRLAKYTGTGKYIESKGPPAEKKTHNDEGQGTSKMSGGRGAPPVSSSIRVARLLSAPSSIDRSDGGWAL